MPEETGSTHIERVRIDVEAPSSKIAAPDSGLNVAIRKLTAIDRLMARIEGRWASMARAASAIGGARGGGGSSAFAGSGASVRSSAASGGGSIITQIDRFKGTERLSTEVREALDGFASAVKITTKKFTKEGEVETTANRQSFGRGRRSQIENDLAVAQARQSRDLHKALGGGASSDAAANARAIGAMAREYQNLATANAQVLNATGQQVYLSQLLAKAESLRVQEKKLLEQSQIRGVGHLEKEAGVEKRKFGQVLKGTHDRSKAEREAAANYSGWWAKALADRDKAEDIAQAAAGKRASNREKADRRIESENEKRKLLSGRVDRLKHISEDEKTRLRSLPNESLRHAIKHAEMLDKQLKKTSETNRYIGRNMVENIGKVAAWSASVGVLYKGWTMVGTAISAATRTQYQAARLSAVLFDPSQTGAVTGDVMRMAGIFKRPGAEGMESAIQWGRKLRSRGDIAEAVRVSMKAANVAEISTGESTEHFSAIKETYKLRVSELSGLLGQLNTVSNTYNVTVKDMLEGLSRTAAVAAQAKIPLAELVGIIGAGVGATGQSGANLGNAAKSILGAFASTDVQNRLRDDFKFETTSGGGNELKGMSQILAELFVHYQKLSDAEKKTMIFSVAGKHQASRMAAILDSYVRAQVLAINATNNLTSADEENAAITKTLQANLQGVMAEFERFAYMQGSNGPIAGLNGTAKALQNVLKIANTPGANLVVTGGLGLLVALTARLAVTTVQLQKAGGGKAGFIANTLAAVAGAGRGLGEGIRSALQNMPQFAQRLAGLSGVFGPQAVAQVSLWRGALAVALGTLAQMAPWIIGITAGVWAFNKGMDHMSAITEASADSISQWTKDAEAAASAGESAAIAARLFKTAQDALGTMPNNRSKLVMLRDVAEAAYPLGPGVNDRERQSQIQALQKSFALMLRENRIGEIALKLEDLRTQAIIRRAQKRQEEYEALRKEEDEYKRSIERIDSGLFAGGFTDASKAKSKQEIERKQVELQERRAKMQVQDADNADRDYKEFLSKDLQHLTYLERQKTVLSEMANVMQQIKGAGRVDDLNKEVAQLEIENRYHKAQLAILVETRRLRQEAGVDTRTEDMLKKDKSSRHDRIARLKKSMSPIEQQWMLTLGAGASFGAFAENPNQPGSAGRGKAFDIEGIKAAIASTADDSWRMTLQHALSLMQQIEKEQLAILDLEKKIGAETETTSNMRESKAIDEAREKVRDSQAALDARASEVRRLAELSDRRAVANRLNGAGIDALGIGDGEGSQFVNQRDALRRRLRDREGALSVAEETQAPGTFDNLAVEAYQMRARLTEMAVRGEERLIELQRDGANILIQQRREYERMLLLQGPGDLLRKLAVNQIGRRGMNSGSFFALSTEARQDWLSRPENSEELRQNRRDQTALRRGGFGRQSLSEIQNAYIESQNVNRLNLTPMAGAMEINEAARIAVGELTGLGKAASYASAELMKIKAPEPAGGPRNPQSPR